MVGWRVESALLKKLDGGVVEGEQVRVEGPEADEADREETEDIATIYVIMITCVLLILSV